MWMEIAAAVINYVVAQNKDIKDKADLSNRFAQSAQDIIAATANMIKAGFDQAKIDQAKGKITYANQKYQEYLTTPEDQSLVAIINYTGEGMELLQQSSVDLAGLTSWIAASGLRILAFQERGKAIPSELKNARSLAIQYSNYIIAIAPRAGASARGRVTDATPSNITGPWYAVLQENGVYDAVYPGLIDIDQAQSLVNTLRNQIETMTKNKLNELAANLASYGHSLVMQSMKVEYQSATLSMLPRYTPFKPTPMIVECETL